ncbi:enoyl-CoA hydratase [Aureimonas altamirensis]|uniref:Enoyl-CoA hydratase n=1 Tax=Aureimonas altamirensis TaxID=370622 RepID=A0A0B1Q9F8_9HYPH|nr:crotonase/enoyl-CoA hydratase family protein [Aureimonas altamirensis]KHJ56006.1 enoyl-CoA hydratase [Aureimonas altamirensis]
MSELVIIELADGVMTLTLNRPDKKNALNQPMYAALADALDRAGADDAVRVVVVQGAEGAFCAGNDIGDFMRFAREGVGLEETWRFLEALGRLEKPLIAAVDGLAIGIGTTLMFHCDMAFATARSLFRTPFLDLGVVPEAASSLLAPRVMGPQKAFSLLVMGDPLDGRQAADAGLVTLVEDGLPVADAARQAARRLARKPQGALDVARRLMRGDREEVRQRIRDEVAAFDERLRSPEARAAFDAFMARSSSAA